jgi:hypothetical protein
VVCDHGEWYSVQVSLEFEDAPNDCSQFQFQYRIVLLVAPECSCVTGMPEHGKTKKRTEAGENW